MKLFRGTAKYLQKTLTFRRNTIVGVFFVYLLWELFKQLITEVTHDQKVERTGSHPGTCREARI